jgi:NDP-sugar pyrophosphorylase family protein
MITQAVVLAGGQGTRLRPVTYEIPKPLVPVQGKPILTWQARWFARAGVVSLLVIVPVRWVEAFRRWQKDLGEELPSLEIVLWEETEPLGTMGALVHELRPVLKQDAVFVTNGDELKGLDLAMLAAFHEREAQDAKYAVSIALLQVPNPWDYGVAEMDGRKIRRFHEKPAQPPSNLINSGLYALRPSVLEELAGREKFLMFEKELFPMLAESGRLGGCALSGPWYDCGTLERWEKAIHEWREPGV